MLHTSAAAGQQDGQGEKRKDKGQGLSCHFIHVSGLLLLVSLLWTQQTEKSSAARFGCGTRF